MLESLQQKMALKDYEGGITLLRKNKDTFDKSVYHYNMGMLKFHSNDLLGTRYHLEMAKLSGGESMDLNNKLELVKTNLGVNYQETPEVTSDYIYQGYYSTPGSLWLMGGLIILGVAMFSVKKAQYWLTGILGAFLISFLIVYKIYIGSTNLVIWKDDVTLYRGPSEVFETTDVVVSGSKLVVKSYDNGWYQILSPSNLSGWLKSGPYFKLKE